LDIQNHLDIGSVKVITEHYIGIRNDLSKQEGRIDILLIDKNEKSISLENKIDAGDQTTQIERYFEQSDYSTYLNHTTIRLFFLTNHYFQV
jgi:hypothetical protein